MPEWPYVRGDPNPANGKPLHDYENKSVILEGTVVQGVFNGNLSQVKHSERCYNADVPHIAFEDLSYFPYTHDMNFEVLPDMPAYTNLLAPATQAQMVVANMDNESEKANAIRTFLS